MDIRTWRLAIGAMILALIGLVLDAAIDSFQVNGGFWAFLSAVLGFLGAQAMVKVRNGNGNGKGQVNGNGA